MTESIINGRDEVRPVHHVTKAQTDWDTSRSLYDFMERSWSTESFGCRYDYPKPMSAEDRLGEDILRAEVYHDGVRWVVPVLRSNRSDVFPPSFDMARRRAQSLEKKLDKSTRAGNGLAALCYNKMEKMLQEGHFHKLPAEEAARTPGNTWYLPLLAVTNNKKPEKVRVVLDAAAKSGGRCLNDYLLRGPDYFNVIPDVLL